ncbi:MAG: hypothetical protein CMM46_14020 [Rhodospirillaceae bacterium]|nr:hypothetical protein [Rhodospirillaceae bacterium]
MELARFFEGPIQAWGMVVDGKGRVRRRFRADIVGRKDEAKLVLDESFLFDDGERDSRVWTICEADGELRGSAEDVLGEACGELRGAILHWNYEMFASVGSRKVKVCFNDWVVQVDQDVMLARADIRKFGFRVGEVILDFIRPQSNTVIASEK